jgi:hypothetical protein
MARLKVIDAPKLGRLVMEVVKDPRRRAELLRNPEQVLMANGVDIDPNIQRVIVVEDTPATVHIVIPADLDDAKAAKDPDGYARILGEGVPEPGCRFS